MEKYELIKMNCIAVFLVKDGDKVLREETASKSCYSIEEMNNFWVEAKAEANSKNTTPNRKSRRGADKTT